MAQLAAHDLAMVRVAGSNPVYRSILYIEVKGYETERDKIKWNTCKNKGIKLLVLKKNEIYQIKNNNFISIENFDIIK